ERVIAFLGKANDELDRALRIATELNIALPEIAVADSPASGYLPDVLCNYIALLGWNPGNDVERFDLDFLCKTFDFDRINKANSKFAREKLLAFNAEALQAMPPDDFMAKLRDHDPALAQRLGERFG